MLCADYLHHTRLSQDPYITQPYRHQMQFAMSFYEISLWFMLCADQRES